MSRISKLDWDTIVGLGIKEYIPDTSSECVPEDFSSSSSSQPSPSSILDRRSNAHVLDHLAVGFGPRLDQHRWGQVFSVLSCFFQFRNRRLIYSVHGLHLELPNAELHQLTTWWSAAQSSSVSSCTCSHPIGHQSSNTAQIHVPSFPIPEDISQPQSASACTAPSTCSSTPLTIEGQLDEFTVFVICLNRVVVALRLDAARLSSTVQCPIPVQHSHHGTSSPCSSSTNHLPAGDSASTGYALQHQSVICLSSIKMTYHHRSRKSSTTELDSDNMEQMDSGYPVHATDALQHQLFWLPELIVNVSSADKINLGSECAQLLPQETTTTIPASNRSLAWLIRFTATKSVQVFVHLASDAHQVAFCLKALSFRWALSSSLPDRNAAAVNGRAVPSSQIKLSCESALMRCDSENIAVFKQFTLRRRPHALHHRTDYNKLGLLRKCNTAWEFDADLVYFTFPYRYRFLEFYQEVSGARLLKLKDVDNRLSGRLVLSGIYAEIA
ncbi:unnamed protein product [Echinostoma caproni]|uniref:Anaphase-promoting complex subunit 1 n=1 Tax=Echinostoma caproni TaxID=27848 RepID=A0A183AJV2_9TREM|nr:unnamed protein product [Echinostoma caproni]